MVDVRETEEERTDVNRRDDRDADVKASRSPPSKAVSNTPRKINSSKKGARSTSRIGTNAPNLSLFSLWCPNKY